MGESHVQPQRAEPVRINESDLLRNPAYGDTVTTTVSASNTSPAACRTWAAIIYIPKLRTWIRTGSPMAWRMLPADSRTPMGRSYPISMGWARNPRIRIIVARIRISLLNTTRCMPTGTTWVVGGYTVSQHGTGSLQSRAPATKSCTDTVGHHHIPTPEVLKRLGDRYAAHGITVHFDVGKIGNANNCNNEPSHTAITVLASCTHTDWVDDYTSTAADLYLAKMGVGTNVATLARGGELIKEVACGSADPQCNFPDYPGTVGWKVGFLALRNAPVGDDGQELNPNLTDPNDTRFQWTNSPEHRLRFDRERRPYFHYGLNAHTRVSRVPRRPIIPSFMFRPVRAVSPICRAQHVADARAVGRVRGKAVRPSGGGLSRARTQHVSVAQRNSSRLRQR